MALVAHKYMPDEMSKDELRATFAAREHTLDYLVKALRDQIQAETLTSYLLTGPRGAGKTTLLLMLQERIKEDANLNAAWLVVRFPEELPGVTSLRDLLSAALGVLAEEGVPLAQTCFEQVEKETDEEQSQDIALRALRQIAEQEGKRLILFVENLDMLFERALDEQQQATLRRLLMNEPFLMIVGTAVRVFEALQRYDEAFFNYFCPVSLDRLDNGQVQELLLKRADYDDNKRFKIAYPKYEAKIKALTLLTGGNPRLILMLYEVLSLGDVQPIIQTLRQLIDELTPLLKDVLEKLPTQQSKIIDALMRAGGTATPSQLTQTARLPLNTVTTQLRRLKEAHMVEVRGGGKGRKAYYFVPDQLFRTWYQMRYLRPQQRRIEIFVEVIRIWFDAEQRFVALQELVGKDKGAGKTVAMSAEYFAASLAETKYAQMARDLAVSSWLQVGDIQQAARSLADLETTQAQRQIQQDASAYTRLAEWSLDHEDAVLAVESLRQAITKHPGNIKLQCQYASVLLRSGEVLDASRVLDEVIRSRSSDLMALAWALNNRGAIKGKQGDLAGALADCTAAIELPGAPADEVAWALNNRGVSKGEQGDPAGELADYTAAIELPGASADQVAKALNNRGAIKGKQGDLAGALADYTAAIELPGAPADEVAWALNSRGVSKGEQGDLAGALADCTAAIELPGAPADEVAWALNNRGVSKGEQGDPAGELADYTAAIELPGASADQVAKALNNRGAIKGKQGDLAGALADFTALIELPGAPADQVARALNNRGVSKGKQGDPTGALADYTAAIELPGAPADQVAWALNSRGVSKGKQGDPTGELADYTAAIELPDLITYPEGSSLLLDATIFAFETAWELKDIGSAKKTVLLFGKSLEKTSLQVLMECVTRFLSRLAEPDMREAWPKAYRWLLEDQPDEVAEMLRGCLKSLQTGQAAGHNVNHSDVDHGFAGLG